MQDKQESTQETTADQIKDETLEGLSKTYEAVFDLICEGKLILSDIGLLDNCAKGQGIFSLEARFDENLDPDEEAAIEARYKQAQIRVKEIEKFLPHELQEYADASWAYAFLTEGVSFSRGVIDCWASKIEQVDLTSEEIKAVLNTIILVEKNISQFDNEGNPYYLFAGSTELWLLKMTDQKNWQIKDVDSTYTPLPLSKEQHDALRAWKRPIHDIDCCVPQSSGVNTKILFNYGQIEHAGALFDLGDNSPDEPVYNAEFRPTASDLRRYLVLNIGGYRIGVATPEYCLAFKKLHLKQHPDKENAEMDLALLEALAPDVTAVEKIYQENLLLVEPAPNDH